MRFHVLTLFPEMIDQAAQTSILGRAIEGGHIGIQAVNIRDYTKNKHKKVDDYPYGGGAGMLMQAQPVYDCYQAVTEQIWETRQSVAAAEKMCGTEQVRTEADKKPVRVIYLTPQGRTFNQKMAEELSQEEDLVFLCGHYEGIDERVLEEIVTDYVSIGDYVLTGGELPSMIMIDAIARLVPGVLHNEVSADFETFHNDLLEYPQYSRPEEWMGKKVPEVLLSGDHKKIEAWRLEESKKRTKERRPDLYEKYDRKQRVIERLLKKNKLLYMDMIESLRRGMGELVWEDAAGVIVHDAMAGIYMAAVFEGGRSSGRLPEKVSEKLSGKNEEAEKIAEVLLKYLGEKDQIVIHQEFLLTALEKRLPIEKIIPMRQAVYTQRVSVPVSKNIECKALGIEDIEEVLTHYHMVSDREYIADRLISGNIFGAYVDGRLAGFAGTHLEGSIGMLEVFEEYRRQGVGKALESFMINRHLSLGYTPYGQVVEDNEASFGLQDRMGLYISKEIFYWVVPEE